MRPSDALTDQQVIEQLRRADPQLRDHHLQALLPCVRLAVDCEVHGMPAEALSCLYRAAYWSSQRPTVKVFSPNRLDRIHLKAVLPLAVEARALSPAA